MEDQIPIGTLVKRKPKPGVAYEVLGLGLVTKWENGFFTLEGFSYAGEVYDTEQPDATRLRATNGTNSEAFDAENDQDLREKPWHMSPDGEAKRPSGRPFWKPMAVSAV